MGWPRPTQGSPCVEELAVQKKTSVWGRAHARHQQQSRVLGFEGDYDRNESREIVSGILQS